MCILGTRTPSQIPGYTLVYPPPVKHLRFQHERILVGWGLQVLSVTWLQVVERPVHCSWPLPWTGWARFAEEVITRYYTRGGGITGIKLKYVGVLYWKVKRLD